MKVSKLKVKVHIYATRDVENIHYGTYIFVRKRAYTLIWGVTSQASFEKHVVFSAKFEKMEQNILKTDPPRTFNFSGFTPPPPP